MSSHSPEAYTFKWPQLGDLARSRPNLGPHLRLEAYRLMLFCLRQALESELGPEAADAFFQAAGRAAGRSFHHHAISPKPADLNGLLQLLQARMRDLGLGVMRVENADDNLNLTLTLTEDAGSAGAPDNQPPWSAFDEGFLSGVMEAFAGRPFAARLMDYWNAGDGTRRFQVKPR